MKRKLLLLVCCFAWLLTTTSFLNAQPIYNQINVTQDVLTTHYDDSKPLRVMEYSTDQAGTIIRRRLEALPENDLPLIKVQRLDKNLVDFPFVNAPPFDALFDDGAPDYKIAETAATLMHGTEVSLKVIKDKFGWLGIDNQSVNGKPIIWNVVEAVNPNSIPAPKYGPVQQEFFLFADGDELEKTTRIETVCHEIVHAIIHSKVGSAALAGVDPCGERNVLEESIGDIIGLYVLNEYEQNSPALYQWTWSKGLIYQGRPFDNPNNFNLPDTYYGNFYASTCPIAGNFTEHQNATVIDHWYYLLAAGTTGTETNDLGYSYHLNGIGVHKAAQIVWKCIDFLSLKSNFKDLKDATLKAAEQLYGLHSTEYLAVMDAWCAVGICDNNLGPFYMSPAHGATGVEPWPGVNVNVTWEGLPVDEWEVQMATNAAFTENVQNVLIKNFSVVIKPGGGSAYSGFATGYYHPGERVYARARITKAGANFCKGYNPLCVLFQQYGPAHAFTLDDKQAKFWHMVPPSDHWTVNPWNDPEIEWKMVSNSQQYTYQVAEDDAFTKITYTGTAPYTGNFPESGVINTLLDPGKTYYTRVRAERFNSPSITDNFGVWSKAEPINVSIPLTSIMPALKQKPGDPPKVVSTLGLWVNWYTYPGASHYVIQAASDPAFANVLRSQTVAGNLTSIQFALPAAPDQTHFYLRVLPQRGSTFGICDNVLHVKTNENATFPTMKSPADGSVFPFMDTFGTTFEWNGGTVNPDLIHHFRLKITQNGNLTSYIDTPGKNFSHFSQDPLIYSNKQGFTMSVQAINELGAKSGFSSPFSYTICADHPGVSFPGDLGKVDPSKNFNIEWYPSAWFDPGSQYLVTIKQSGNIVPGFNNKPTTDNFMLVPAGTLPDGKNFTVSVKNSSACANLPFAETFFVTKSSGGSNQPQPPKLVNFNIEIKGFRNDPDGTVFPPAWGTSNFRFGLRLIDPVGSDMTLLDANGDPVSHLDVDSENSGVIMLAQNQPEGKYKLKLEIADIFDPFSYYPFDQPRFSVLVNGEPVVTDHVITIDLIDPDSQFNEFKKGFKYADIVLDVK